jgi:hypothetical protein
LRIDQPRKRSASNHFALRISSHHFDIALRDLQLNYGLASAVD